MANQCLLCYSGNADISEVTPNKTHYEWACISRGRALICYTESHSADAKQLEISLKSLQYKTELMKLEECSTFKKIDKGTIIFFLFITLNKKYKI